MRKLSVNQNGYTLLELLVILMIVCIMVALIVINLASK